MNHDQFEEALSRYGGDFNKWPASARADAEALAATDRRAAAMLAAARRLDGLLSAIASPRPVEAALVGRIAAGIDNGKHRDVTVRPSGRLAAWAGAAVVLFLAAGFAVGLALPQSQGEDAFAGLMFGGSAAASTSPVEDLL